MGALPYYSATIILQIIFLPLYFSASKQQSAMHIYPPGFFTSKITAYCPNPLIVGGCPERRFKRLRVITYESNKLTLPKIIEKENTNADLVN